MDQQNKTAQKRHTYKGDLTYNRGGISNQGEKDILSNEWC
jgi:hypothetical protein